MSAGALLQEYPRGSPRRTRTIPAYTESLAAAQAAKSAADAPVANVQSRLSPEEQIGQAIDLINADVADDLLARLHAQEPAFFEQAVLDLLMAMGYGGAEGNATRTQSRTMAVSTASSIRMRSGSAGSTFRPNATPSMPPWDGQRSRHSSAHSTATRRTKASSSLRVASARALATTSPTCRHGSF